MSSHEETLQPVLSKLRDFRLYRANPTFLNPAWSQATLRVLILRLSTFADVERSTPHLFLAGEVRRGCASAFIDMAFLPRRDDARLMEEMGLPLILGTQSHRPAGDFDLLLVSNSYLLELANLFFLFARSGIPIWSSERRSGWPLVVLGGSNASAAHALLSENGDCAADAIFFGEGEGAVARIAEGFHRLSHLPRAQQVAALAEEIDGLWPAGDAPREVRKGRRDPAAAPPEAASPPVLPGAEASTARLTITLGCPCLCSFCFEGHDRRPFREIPAEALVAEAHRIKRDTGASTLEIESNNFNTHRELPRLLVSLNRLFLRVGLMSQRADVLARTPGLLDLEIAADKRTFTLGIEGISARQRRFLHKSLPDEDISRTLETLHERRVREIKLFYIVTGRESEADFAELSAFVKWLREIRGRAEAPPRVVFSFGTLVRMPFTPLRYDPPLLSEATWRPLVGKAKSICETHGFEFRLSHAWPEHAATQALALPDSSLHGLLGRIAEKGSVSSDGLPPGAAHEVEKWIEERGAYLLKEKPAETLFPFPFLETEVSRKAFHRMYLGARAGKDAGYAASWGVAKRKAIPRESILELAGITQGKHRLNPIYVKAVVPPEAAGLGIEWLESWLMRRFFAVCPGQLENVLCVKESLIGPSGLFPPDLAWSGRSVAAVTAWDRESFSDAVRRVPGPFEGEVPGFIPGAWTCIHVALALPALQFPRPADRLAAFLRDAHAPVTIQRDRDSFRLVVPEKSSRRRIIMEGSGTISNTRARIELGIGAKFRLGDFLDSFGTPAAARAAEVEVLSLE